MSLTNTFDEQGSQLAVLKAEELELTEGPDAALQYLGPPSDPIRMNATLSILIRAERLGQAFAIVQNAVPNEKWLHLAVFVFANRGNEERASDLILQAELTSDLSLIRRCRVSFAEGVVLRLAEKYRNDSLLAVHDWAQSDIELAESAMDRLDPILSLVKANLGITSELQLSAVQNSVILAHILGHDALLNECVAFLVHSIPLPKIVAELCLRGKIKVPEHLADRLRTEYPDDFQSALLAAIIERDLMDRPDDALNAMFELSSRVTSNEEKQAVAIALFETSGRCGPEQISRAFEAASFLMPDDVRLAALFTTIKLLSTDDISEAKNQLSSIRDENDAVWWQAKAYVSEKEGNEEEAQKAWERAADLLPHPDVLRRSVSASLDRRRYESAIRALKQLVEKGQAKEKDIEALAWSLGQVGDFKAACIYLEKLVAINPHNAKYREGFARSLARCARISEAIEVLEPICSGDEPDLEINLLQSELLATNNREQEAFKVLERLASDHWDSPTFVLTFMYRAQAAGKEKTAYEAYVRLLELRSSGKVPAELMQAGTLDQLLAYGEEYRTRRASLQESVVRGRLPWLFVEDILGNPPMWSWRIHTQELQWLSEEQLNRAAYSVYSTNSFSVCNRVDSKRLEPIACAPAGGEVVVDLSALLTLHQLGMLTSAAEFFGQLILPASYGDLRTRDASRFGQHQPSREVELKKIREAIERRRISVSNEQGELPLVDEYSDDSDKPAFRIRDILEILKKTQRIPESALDEMYTVAHRPEISSSNVLKIGQRIVIALSTLRTLALKSAFVNILDAFEVFMLASDQRKLHSELQAHDAARDARHNYEELWNTVIELESQQKLKWMPVQRADSDETFPEFNEGNTLPSLHLDSLKMARILNKPLLADDRVIQVQMFNSNCSESWYSFGSELCVLALAEAGRISNKSCSDAFLKMMRWRYRFLIPDAITLKSYADDCRNNLPGDSLLDVAEYLHGCLRDPGLHCGIEDSEPPMPMAAKLATTWMDVVVTFLTYIWNDGEYSESEARQLTLWAGEELIPVCPRGMWWGRAGLNLARILDSSALQSAFVHFASVEDLNRANVGLRTLAEALGLDEYEFLENAVEAINAIK